MTNQQLEDTLHRIDNQLEDISSDLRSKVDNVDFTTRMTSMYSVLEKSMTNKFKQLANELGSNHSGTQTNDNVYTKTEIDAKGFLTEHQSLDAYVTKDYAEHNYLNINDVHGLMS